MEKETKVLVSYGMLLLACGYFLQGMEAAAVLFSLAAFLWILWLSSGRGKARLRAGEAGGMIFCVFLYPWLGGSGLALLEASLGAGALWRMELSRGDCADCRKGLSRMAFWALAGFIGVMVYDLGSGKGFPAYLEAYGTAAAASLAPAWDALHAAGKVPAGRGVLYYRCGKHNKEKADGQNAFHV